MEAIVRGELERLAELALAASRTGASHRETALDAATSHISAALSTLLHVGLLTEMAYTTCRDLSLAHLAWSHHTAASESSITEALAAGADDPERIRRACALGFADRGRDQVKPHEL